jgi:5-methylcytosine-specific restriction endonuclease McrA
MQQVFVLNQNQTPLMPCNPAKARRLLKMNRAKIYRRYPFTIIMNNKISPALQPIELKIDPGSKTTGISLVKKTEKGHEAIWAANLNHRGIKVKEALLKRRTSRRNRRCRKTRYRACKVNNRQRKKGWLSPSLQSRINNVYIWTKRLIKLTNIVEMAVEIARFDTQKIENPEILGVEYQHGTLFGYEIREYLLEKFSRTCIYCGTQNVPLEIDHVNPKSRGGTDKISNLVLACHECNQEKGNRDIKEFVKNQNLLAKILRQIKSPLRDVATMNSIRHAIGNKLKSLGLPTSFWTGGCTKYNRTSQGYLKDHWIDAACVGETGAKVYIGSKLKPITINALGRGSRRMCSVDKFGFPRSKAKQVKRINEFQTGDTVRLNQTVGKYIGFYIGTVTVRARGEFDILIQNGNKKRKITASWKKFKLLQKFDGYSYLI